MATCVTGSRKLHASFRVPLVKKKHPFAQPQLQTTRHGSLVPVSIKPPGLQSWLADTTWPREEKIHTGRANLQPDPHDVRKSTTRSAQLTQIYHQTKCWRQRYIQNSLTPARTSLHYNPRLTTTPWLLAPNSAGLDTSATTPFV